MRKNILWIFAWVWMALVGCQSYQYANNVKLLSFDDGLRRGKSVGPVEGRECVWHVFGFWLGSEPRLDNAIRNAASQRSTGIISETVGHASSETNPLRYMNDVSTEHDGFNAWFIGKECLIVKGKGFR